MSFKRVYHSMSGERQVKAFWQVYDAYDPDINSWECSNCKEPFVLCEGTPSDNKYHFCPRCGAMMIGYETLKWEDDDD